MIMSKRTHQSQGPYRLCAMPYPSLPHYVSVLSVHATLAEALTWGRRSGISAWTGPSAIAAGYPPEGRRSQLWIEKVGAPASRVAVCR